ncbi:MAG: hypothetical protein KF681_15265 [Bdellovibrionaceae bacterium]|nr:hypothetical protein [Pseudobdellovibrionaceae bacterium]
MKAWTLLPICFALAACNPKKASDGSVRPRQPMTSNKPLTLEEEDAFVQNLSGAGRLEWALSASNLRDSDPLVKEMKEAIAAAGSKCARNGRYDDTLSIQSEEPVSDNARSTASPTPSATPAPDEIAKKEFVMRGSACPVDVKITSTINKTRRTFSKDMTILLNDEALVQKNGFSKIVMRIRNGKIVISGNKRTVLYQVKSQVMRSNKTNLGISVNADYQTETMSTGEVRIRGSKTIFSTLAATGASLRMTGDGSANVQFHLNSEPINAPTYEGMTQLLGPLMSGLGFE